nr:hypothetical protein [uncultured Prevotella sp.]
MSSSTYNRLTTAGFKPEQALQVRKTVATQEKGIKYTLDVKANYPSAVFQVDGYIIKSGRKCDKLVLVNTKSESPEEWTQIFVELKGHDAVHGIEQLLETAKNDKFSDKSNKTRKARLVATSIPSNRANPMVEKLKRDFKKIKVDYKSLKPGQKDYL